MVHHLSIRFVFVFVGMQELLILIANNVATTLSTADTSKIEWDKKKKEF